MAVASKRVAVIGAGACGIGAIKSCLDEDLEPVCFERTNDIGGLWNYSDDAKDGQACVMKSTVINTSKEIMCFSDFPVPKEFPNYMHNTKVLEYFRKYTDHFKLLPYIHFGVEVLSITQSADYAETGRWDITLQEDGKERTETFDAVLVCSGHHADKNMAKFPGEENFKGKKIHSHDYRNHKGYEDKRVVIIGFGNSGGDIAVELSKIAKQVYLSTRRGAWVLNRVGQHGLPFDIEGLTRFQECLPLCVRNFLLENLLNKRFNHKDYGLKPDHHIFSAHPMVNDELPNRIICGTVIIKPNVESITETGVKFEDGSLVNDVDVIIYATGYTFGFPFIKHPALEVKANKLPLFKYMYPPDFAHPTLAVIGFIQPWGALNPISELQCRLATHVLKGHNLLPSKEAMWHDICQKEEEMAQRYAATPRHTIQVNFIPFLDELAALLGCKPDIKHLFLTDPLLAWQVFFGAPTPYQYRLTGPGAWPGARAAIMSQMERILYPLRETRKVTTKDQGHFRMVPVVLLGAATAGVVCLMQVQRSCLRQC